MSNMWSSSAIFFCSVCEKMTSHFSFSSLQEFSFLFGALLNIQQVLHFAKWSTISSAYNDFFRLILTCLILTCRRGKFIILYSLHQFLKACWRISLRNMAIHLLHRGKTTCSLFELHFPNNWKKRFLFILLA